jgi:hypothetical protein
MTTFPAHGDQDPATGPLVAPPGFPANAFPAPGEPVTSPAPAGRQPLPEWVANPAQNPNLGRTGIALAQAAFVMCLLGVLAGWGWFVVLTLPLWLMHALNVYLGGAFYELPHHVIDRVRAVRAATVPGAAPLPPARPAPSPRTNRRLVINGIALVALLLGTVLWSTVGPGGPLGTKCGDFISMPSTQQAQLLAKLNSADLAAFEANSYRCVDPNATLGSIIKK